MLSDVYSQTLLEQHSLDMRQFAGFRQFSLPNGLRALEAYNTSGLRYTILIDRGLDIWAADFRGTPLTWIAPGSPFQPDFGQKWLAQFSGGLLTTCGLIHVGGPEQDDATGEFRDLHGWYTRLRAADVAVTSAWEHGDYLTRLTAEVVEGYLHGYHLRLKRTYELSLTAPEIRIRDLVTNAGDTLAPLMFLYHFNMGYPLVRAGTEFRTASQVYPRNDDARRGYDRWHVYDGPGVGRPEEVFFHHVRAQNDQTEVALVTGASLALSLQYSTANLPYLTQWKNMRSGMYVHGVEPGNCIPEGLNAARKTGRLHWLEPGETRDFGQIVLRVCDDADDVHALSARIDTLRREGLPVASCVLTDYN
jgi:hypothetical protein